MRKTVAKTYLELAQSRIDAVRTKSYTLIVLHPNHNLTEAVFQLDAMIKELQEAKQAIWNHKVVVRNKAA